MFGPNVKPLRKIQQNPVGNDIVPVALHSIQLTEQLLRTATATDLTQLRTVETDREPLQSTRVRRRPEAKPPVPDGRPTDGLRQRSSRVQAALQAESAARDRSRCLVIRHRSGLRKPGKLSTEPRPEVRLRPG